MANNLESNITRKLIRVFLEKFEASRVLVNTVDTQLLTGKFNPQSGSIVDFKRPHDYNTIRTGGGDITGAQKSEIIAGKASGVVQDYFTVATEWGNIEEALELDQLDQILAPMATRMVTDLELDFGRFMLNNAGLVQGDPDTPVSNWKDVADAGALMKALGIPQDVMWTYAMNPFTQTALADKQNQLSPGGGDLVISAWKKAQIPSNFGGLAAISSNALSNRLSGTATDRAGALSGTPDGSYLTAKDTMTQVLPIDSFTGSETILAGEIIQVTGRNRLNMATRQTAINAAGDAILWTAVVVQDLVLVGGAGNLVVSGPALNEVNGQYNTVDNPLTIGDVVTVLGTANKLYQPNLFYHKQAFGIGTVKLPKLFSTDTLGTTEDGFSIRVSKYSDGDANQQKIRFDLLPAFAVFNPFFAGQGYGTTP